jgi:hypothetical protein
MANLSFEEQWIIANTLFNKYKNEREMHQNEILKIRSNLKKCWNSPENFANNESLQKLILLSKEYLESLKFHENELKKCSFGGDVYYYMNFQKGDEKKKAN